MRSSWDRRDRDKEERLYNALGATLNTFIEAEGASNAVVAQACGEFLAMVFAGLSVENGDSEEQIAGRLAVYTQALAESVCRNVQTLHRARSQ